MEIVNETIENQKQVGGDSALGYQQNGAGETSAAAAAAAAVVSSGIPPLTKRHMNFQSPVYKRSKMGDGMLMQEVEEKVPRSKPTTSFNLKTLTPIEFNLRGTFEPYLKNYFKKLSNVAMNTDIKNFYYNGSTITLSKLEGAEYKLTELAGDVEIYKILCRLGHYKKYNVVLFNIQPGLGQGAAVFLTGTLGTEFNVHQHKFSMSLTIVRLRKKYYIQNQFFHIE